MKYNLIGQTFTYLTVIDGPIKIENKKGLYWKCKCKCGNEKFVSTYELNSGNTKSCGCYKNEIFIGNNKKRQTLNLTNKKFGKLTALYPTDKRKDSRIIWYCKCDCGNYIETDTHALQSGHIKSCGCMKSNGEFIISLILKENAIPFVLLKSFESCRFPENNYLAKFDFYINNKYIIEYDGLQHFWYKDNPHTWNNHDNHLLVIQHDLYKNQWCKENNIPLIRIPYTHLKKICLEDLLLETSQFIVK